MVAAAIDSGCAKVSSVIIRFCTPTSPSDSVCASPRRLGSLTSVLTSGAGLTQTVGQVRDIVGRLKQQSVAGEKCVAAYVLDRAE